MTETIQTAMDRLMTISAEPQDYVAEDGLLYCGSCNTPKEAFFPNGRKLFGRDRHPAECLCRQAVREKQEAEEKARLHHENVRRLKLQGFTDWAIYNIIDSRYRSRKPLIVTTNLTLTELKNPQDTAHARIYDRLLELCTPIACTGPSMRKNIGQGKLDFLKTLLV